MVAESRCDRFVLLGSIPELTLFYKTGTSHGFQTRTSPIGIYVGIFSLIVTASFLGFKEPLEPVELSNLGEQLQIWHEVLAVWWIVYFFLQHLYIVRMNYMSV